MPRLEQKVVKDNDGGLSWVAFTDKIPVIGKPRQEAHAFRPSLGYIAQGKDGNL